MYILDGLDMVFVTSVSMRVSFPPFRELRSLLLASRYKPMPTSSTPLATDYALVSQVQQTTSDNRGRGRNYRGQGSGRILVLGGKPSSSVICQGTCLPHTWAIKCYHWFNLSYQDDPLAHQVSAMSRNSSADQKWYLDAGATNHMTADAEAWTSSSSYTGNARAGFH